MSSSVPPGQFSLAPPSPVEDPLPVEDEFGIGDDVPVGDGIGVEDDVASEEETSDEEEMSDDEDEFEEDPMDEDQEFVPAPPSPVVSDVSYESFTSDALGYALESEVAPSFEIGESSAVSRVSPSELRAELRHLREGVTWCQERHRSMTRRLGDRQVEVSSLRREVQEDRRMTGELYDEISRHDERLRAAVQSDLELQEHLASLERGMTKIESMVEILSGREIFADIDSRRFGSSIEELWRAVHAMQWEAYYERMERFRFSDSIDVLAVYGGQS